MVKLITKFLKNRTKSWKTTLVGLVILIVVSHLIYLGKTTLTEGTTMIMVGLSLLFSDDTLFIKNFLPNKKDINNKDENLNQE
jgi:hypothetical protein